MLTDTHAHLDDERYGDSRDQMIEKNLKELEFIITVGTHPDEFGAVLQLLEDYKNVYGTVGIHPHYSLKVTTDEAKATINGALNEDKSQNEKIVGIGECGLDYFWANQDLEGRTEYEVREAQRELFISQIEVSKEKDLPLVVHCRDERDGWDAYVDCFDILEEYNISDGVIHSFNGDKVIMQKFVDLGMYIGVSGIVTFDKSGRLQDVIKDSPLEKILLETDSPYLTPVPFRGKINEPAFTRYIAEKIAELKNISIEEVLRVTEENSRNLFGI